MTTVTTTLVTFKATEERSLYVGGLFSDRLTILGVALTASLMLVALVVWPARRWALVLTITSAALAGVVAVIGWAVFVFAASTSVTPLLVNGCPTGYLVEEQSNGLGNVYAVDGIHADLAQVTFGDDSFRPFANGAYAAESEPDGTIRVWFAYSRPDNGTVLQSSPPKFDLPGLGSPDCRG